MHVKDKGKCKNWEMIWDVLKILNDAKGEVVIKERGKKSCVVVSKIFEGLHDHWAGRKVSDFRQNKN